MRDRDYDIATSFLAEFFGGATEHAVELRSLSNDRGGPPKPLFTRDPGMIEAHCQRFDQPDRGMYFGVCTRLLGASQGRRADLAECRALWADIDCDKDKIGRETALLTIRTLPYPPSIVIDSGGGLHLYWLLREAVDVRAGEDEAEESIVSALKQIAGVVGGDPAVCELARVMRVPGTINGKPSVVEARGEPAVVALIAADWQRQYDLDELVEWLDWQRPVIAKPAAAGVVETNPFLAASERLGIKPPLDVRQALESMTFGGAGDTSIHQTQLRVSASLAHAGHDEDEIVAVLIEATRAAAGEHGKAWNWRREEAAIRRMISSARSKFGVREAKVVRLAEERAERARANGTTGGGGASQSGPATAAGPQKKNRKNETADIGDAVIEYWRAERGPLIAVAGELASYAGGHWTIFGEPENHALRVAIQGVMAAQGVEPKTSLLNAVWRYILERPQLLRESVEWNASGLVVCRNGAIDPDTGAVYPHSPDHYATWRIEADIETKAECPLWITFLSGCLSNLAEDERQKAIATLQEWCGAALIRRKSRETTKALIAFGPSRSGKTQLAQVIRALVGGHPSGMRARDLEDRFGMQALIGASAWIADDAVSSGDYLDAERFKVIVTSEPLSIPRKNLTNWEGRLDIPVLLTSNHLPRVRDQSDAVYNRSLILPMTVVRSEEDSDDRPISDRIVEAELGGILNWAIAGWKRLKARRHYDPPRVMRKALDDYKADNNPVGTWAAEALEAVAWSMVDRRDVLASFQGWYVQEFGSEGKIPAGRWFHPSLRQALPTIGDHKSGGDRFITGVRLTDEGIAYLKHAQNINYGKSVGSGATDASVNRSFTPAGPPPKGKEPRF